jgi:cyclic pyranopterin phosphate synthase
MPNEEIEVTPNAQLMSKDEIVRLAKVFVVNGIDKIRLTGGEPLVRKDVDDIMLELSKLVPKLTMTTNGVLIHKHIDILKKANIRSINVSLDTLNEARFLALTKRDQFQQVMENINLLLRENFHVKVNVVAMKGINDKEINQFVAWTKHLPLHVRFIEFMPFSQNEWNKDRVFTFQQILETIQEEYDIIKLQDELHDTTKKYQCIGHEGTFAIISTMTHPFCSSCNRLRLTADGKMKNCLFSKTETDLLSALRKGDNIEPLIVENVLRKEAALGGQLLGDFNLLDSAKLENRRMISIGG